MSKLEIVALEIDPKVAAMLPTLRLEGGVIVVAGPADASVDTSLTAGDVIHAINGARVTSMETLRAALDQMKANSPVVLQIEREGKLMFVSIQLD